MRKAVSESQGVVGVIHPLSRGTKGPIPLNLAVWELLGAQPQPSQGSHSCEMPATTSYHPTASTHMRQAEDEEQSNMKETKEKWRKEKALLRPIQ